MEFVCKSNMNEIQIQIFFIAIWSQMDNCKSVKKQEWIFFLLPPP